MWGLGQDNLLPTEPDYARITLPDVVGYEPADPMAGYDPSIYQVEVSTPAEAVAVAAREIHTSAPEILAAGGTVYEATPEAMAAADDIIAERNAGGTGETAWSQWLAKAGEAALKAVPDLLNRIVGTGRGTYAVAAPKTASAGLGIGWVPLVIGAGVLLLMTGRGRRGARRVPARRRRR